MASRVSDDEKYDVIFFHKHGATEEQIARSMDVKVSRIRYILKVYNKKKSWYCNFINWLGFSING